MYKRESSFFVFSHRTDIVWDAGYAIAIQTANLFLLDLIKAIGVKICFISCPAEQLSGDD